MSIVSDQLETSTENVKEILATGEKMGLRVWNNETPDTEKQQHSHDYETVGYVMKGKAELHLGETVQKLEAGDSYLVPRGVEHKYTILETFSAVEATSPPAHLEH